MSDPTEAAKLTYYQTRSRRKRDVRARTISAKRMTKRELAFGKMIADAELEDVGPIARPQTRADCVRGERPCPFISCEHHLYLDVSDKTGAIKIQFPDIAADHLEQMPASCSLDVSDAGGETLERVGELMNLTRERVRQIEVRATRKLLPLLRDLAHDVFAIEQDEPVPEHDEVDRDGPSHLDARQMSSMSDEFVIAARLREVEDVP